MIDLRKANRWSFPKIKTVNYKREFPKLAPTCFKKWFSVKRFWGGRIIEINIKYFGIVFDFRLCPWSDMAFPDATKKDRKAVEDASLYL